MVLPVIQGMINSIQSEPNMASYLTLCGASSNLLISSMFMTGTVGNPLVTAAANSVLEIDFGFLDWFIGAAVPVGALIAVWPWLLLRMFPFNYDATKVRTETSSKLQELGPMSVKEYETMGLLATCICFWMTSKWTRIPETFIALVAILLMVSLGIIKWDDIVKNDQGIVACLIFNYSVTYRVAWDSFFWLSIMVLIAQQMTVSGLGKSLGNSVATAILSLNVSPIGATILLNLIYLFSMYLFSSLTGELCLIIVRLTV
jgi:di/tricarboxylate transporter